MASREAIQFDSAMGEALDKNLTGVLRNAAEVEKRQALYVFFLCGSYSDQWNEEISTKERASRAVPQLKNRREAVMGLNSSKVPAEVKAACLSGIANSLSFFD